MVNINISYIFKKIKEKSDQTYNKQTCFLEKL